MSKRAFDIAVSILATLVISPLLAIIAIGVFIESRGSILFRATRVGKGGRLFNMYKFPTMIGHRNDGGPRVTASDDPRIIRLGKLLRCTKLNELPQLFNVIKGEMSLVGPRPEDPEFVSHYSATEAEILSIRPGITSPASVIYYDEERLLSFTNAADSHIREIMPRKLRLDVPEIDIMLFGPIQKLAKKYILIRMVLVQNSNQQPPKKRYWMRLIINPKTYGNVIVVALVRDRLDVRFAGIAPAGTIWRERMVLNVGVLHPFLLPYFLPPCSAW